MISDTPRTDKMLFTVDVCDGEDVVNLWFARTLERELNAAEAIIRQQQLLDEENLRLKEHIKQLEDAGDGLLTAMRDDWSEYVDWINETTDAISKWNKAKEDKP